MNIDDISIEEKRQISQMTTMKLGGPARFVVNIKSIDDIEPAYQFAKERNVPIWIMGGGANTIGRDEGFEGVIFLNKIKKLSAVSNGRALEVVNDEIQAAPEELGDEILLTGGGGIEWDDFVQTACELGYTGIEAMSKIPGTVGAAPVQNIGAYGQDIAQVIESVKAFDLHTGEFATINKTEMEMGYRHTRFNAGKDAGRFMIVEVTVRLRKGELEPPFYNSLQRYIDQYHETDFSPMNIRRMVSEIRAEKLPDPEYVASAGSFFKNVYVDKNSADEAKAKGIPIWRSADGGGKINSGWLIEQCDLKGKELYGFRVSEKAALILINETAKSYADLARARAEIIRAVEEKFGYTLEQEPVEIPVEG